MLKLTIALILALLAVALAVPRVQLQRGLSETTLHGHPYLFLTVPRGRGGAVVQGFELTEEDVDENNKSTIYNNETEDDDDENNDSMNANKDDDKNDDDDDGDEPIVGLAQRGVTRAALSDEEIDDNDDDDVENNVDVDDYDDSDDSNEYTETNKMNMLQIVPGNENSPSVDTLQMILQNVKPTQLLVSKEKAGAIMVPDGIIEIEGQSVIDEKTGKPVLLVPRAALDIIPDGSVVALMERSIDADAEEQERANRVIVRRRRRGSRRKLRRRNGNQVRRRKVKYNNYNNYNPQRRRVKRRKNVRVVRRGGNNKRRRPVSKNKRRRNGNRTYVFQG